MAHRIPTVPAADPSRTTGRIVLFALLGFFGVIVAANVVLIREATRTFGGVDQANAYQAGLAFDRELAAAARQEARHWVVSGTVRRDADGVVVEIVAQDAQGVALDGLAACVRLMHPADSRLDRGVDLQPIGRGIYRGPTDASTGQWHLEINLTRAGEQVFRSRSTVVLR